MTHGFNHCRVYKVGNWTTGHKATALSIEVYPDAVAALAATVDYERDDPDPNAWYGVALGSK